MNTEKILMDLADNISNLAKASNENAKELLSQGEYDLVDQQHAKTDVYTSIAHLVLEKIKGLQNV